MIKKSFLTLLFTFAVALLVAPNIFASELEESKLSQNKTIEGPVIVGPVITPLDVGLINTSHIGTSAFDQTFTLTPENGDNLNIWVMNHHSSKSVKFKVSRTDNNQDFGAITLNPGEQKTRHFTMTQGGGMQGTYRVYVYSTDGHKMNLSIAARQF